MSNETVSLPISVEYTSTRRNYLLDSYRKDQLIDWMKAMLYHSFVLNAPETYVHTFSYFEGLISEHRMNPTNSKLIQYVPTISKFFTDLPLAEAFKVYDLKYSITKRRHIPPSFNEIRHILNLAQVISISQSLQLITFDGDCTLYNDGENFGSYPALSVSICQLLINRIRVVLVTAAGYNLNASKYQERIQGLLDSFISNNLTEEQIQRFYVMGGECNYLFQCQVSKQYQESCKKEVINEINLHVVPYEEWQAESLGGPRPFYWPSEQINQILDVSEHIMRSKVDELHLRAKVLRKERACGIFPGGTEMIEVFPDGHGSTRLKREALDEIVLDIVEHLRIAQPSIKLPYCVFNGGRDCWVDIGNKSVGVATLQAYFGIQSTNCLHVGDQFLNTGNDIAARQICCCIWIQNPKETESILQHILKYKGLGRMSRKPTYSNILNIDMETNKNYFVPNEDKTDKNQLNV